MAAEIRSFIDHHFRHFNAATLRDAAQGYGRFLQSDGRMMLTLAGAMSTAELGLSLAEMIRAGKVHAITCTGANLEEDLFNLVAHEHYVRLPGYRYLSKQQELELLQKGLNRVTDTCIPEDHAIRKIQHLIENHWTEADRNSAPRLPHEFCYELIRSGRLNEHFEIAPENSWLVAACERSLPLFVPGWEDSTLGSIFSSLCMRGKLSPAAMRSGIDYLLELAAWYRRASAEHPMGFFQIGGGIAGDFAICVVPMIRQDLGENVPLWNYYCQISDSTTSFGSYSGAVPNEKITWGKIATECPQFIIESDATIVAPLLFAYVLGW
ncbi:deoxyhypusine synthase family protein [Bradyrhizobium sp.]|jgi:deoxyhypusine synthase|uniref:deoxyhypusine synthase family protein n=1 Tax=Bradyrhizobium sp. TaxID=376 RepID=UPI003C144403